MKIVAEDWLAYHAEFTPMQEAMHDLNSDRHFTYAEMHDRVNKVTLYLRHGLKVGDGDRVAVVANNDSDVFEIQFACRRIGAIFLPINWRLAVPEWEYICKDASPTALMYGLEFVDEVAQLSKLCDIPALATLNNGGSSDYENGIAAASGELDTPVRYLDDIGTIMYTSGTTGRPKGAMITYAMGLFNAVQSTAMVDLTHQSKNIVFLPTFHTGGLNVYANPIFHSGGCNVIMRVFDPAYFLELLTDKVLCITHALGVPTNFLMMAQEPGFKDADMSHIVCISVGGAAAPAALIEEYGKIGINLQQMWGMTETGPLGLALTGDKALEKNGSSGKPMMHVQMKICEEDGSPTPIGEVGELMIKGPSVTPGYWNREAENHTFFDDEGYFHTGDAARMDEDGYYYIVDRWKDMFISGGENVYPVEVENVIYQLGGVLENAVIGIPDDKWGEVGRAFVVTKPGSNIDEGAVIDHCKSQLATFKVPKQVRMIEELPHNATGKILKHQLPRE